MQLQLTNLRFADVKDALVRNGFCLAEAESDAGEVFGAEVWSETGGGFKVGLVTLEPGSFPRFTLMLVDGHLGRSRVHGVMTDLLNNLWRA